MNQDLLICHSCVFYVVCCDVGTTWLLFLLLGVKVVLVSRPSSLTLCIKLKAAALWRGHVIVAHIFLGIKNTIFKYCKCYCSLNEWDTEWMNVDTSYTSHICTYSPCPVRAREPHQIEHMFMTYHLFHCSSTQVFSSARTESFLFFFVSWFPESSSQRWKQDLKWLFWGHLGSVRCWSRMLFVQVWFWMHVCVHEVVSTLFQLKPKMTECVVCINSALCM